MLPYAELEARARSVLDDATYAYVAARSGLPDEPDLDAAAWHDIRLRPRVLRGSGSASTATTVLGTAVAAPVLVAPTAAHGAVHAEGEVATARGTAAAGSLLVLSTRSTRRMADVAAAAGPWWMQVYVMRDRALSDAVAAAAAGAGAGAIVLTVDTPYVARKHGAPPTPAVGPLLLPELRMADPQDRRQAPDLGLADISRLAEVSRLPVVVKGVLRGDDARRCVDAGAAGVIVSAHGGRQLPGTVAPAAALAEVVAAVGGDVEVYVDGGVRRGVDVLRALALGARAVLVGRAVVWGLAVGGAAGVRTVLDGLREEAAEALALAGCSAPDDAGPDLVWRLPGGGLTVER